MRFTKMHGIGNDYVYVNGFEQTVEDPAALAVAISDRHFGVGSDGLILILPPQPQYAGQADVRMRMFNADGSEAEMCGNGIRCLAKYVIDHGLSSARPLRVQTARGILSIDYQLDQYGRLATATVDMGRPIDRADQVGVDLPGVLRLIDHPVENLLDWPALGPDQWLQRSRLDLRMTCLSMGNPHAILYAAHLEHIPLHNVGPALENHRIFPHRVNVHFVQVLSPHEVRAVHWERGSGPTLACGTGACAICAAGVLTGRTARRITAHLPGGDLELVWNQTDDHVLMTGPATEVFSGDWPQR